MALSTLLKSSSLPTSLVSDKFLDDAVVDLPLLSFKHLFGFFVHFLDEDFVDVLHDAAMCAERIRQALENFRLTLEENCHSLPP